MSERVEQMFSQLRRGPWNADPMSVPQEGFGGNGNVESSGWLSDGAVTADVIQANAVIAGKIDADAVTAREIAAQTITANEIAANAITANEIAANAITASELAANSVVAGDLQVGAVTAGTIAADVVTATEIAALTITASEIAADAITTTKILAGNVVSSKIELTVSGKNFGANAGGSGAPGVYFDASSNTGMFLDGGDILFSKAGAVHLTLTGGTAFTVGPVRPTADNTISLGSSTKRWTEVWAVNGTIQTSDERLKRDIQDSPLGLEFVKSLRPIAYRWRDTVDTQAIEQAEIAYDREKVRSECKYYEREIERIRADAVAGLLSDDEAEAGVISNRAALAEISEKHEAPWREAQSRRRPGKRLHLGLLAQEVKGALDDVGIDAALWKQTSDGEQALAYIELIAPLIRAVQELDAKVTELAAAR